MFVYALLISVSYSSYTKKIWINCAQVLPRFRRTIYYIRIDFKVIFHKHFHLIRNEAIIKKATRRGCQLALFRANSVQRWRSVI